MSVRRKNSTTPASRFGITEDALSEIGDTVAEELHTRALELSAQQRAARKARVHRGVLPVSGPDDWAASFGMALHPLFVKAFDSYVELLARVVLEHGGSERAIEPRPIVDQALQFCRALEDSPQSAEWLGMTAPMGQIRNIRIAGEDCIHIGQSEHRAFLKSLSRWTLGWEPDKFCFHNVAKRAARIIRHISRLAPRRRLIRRQRQNLTRAMIATAKRDNRGASIESVCQLLDAKHCPLPSVWKNPGFRSWHDIWKSPQHRAKVKRYISGVLPAG